MINFMPFPNIETKSLILRKIQRNIIVNQFIF